MGLFNLKSRLLIGILAILVGTLLPHAGSEAAESPDYFPLEVGRKWVLVGETDPGGKPVICEIVEKSSATYLLRFSNPWTPPVDFHLIKKGTKIFASSVGTSGQSFPLPEGTLYYDLERKSGKAWSSALGDFRILQTDATVQGKQKTYKDCIRLHVKSHDDGTDTYWTFAPGVGPVQFGEDPLAYRIDESQSRLSGGAKAAQQSQPGSTEPPSPRPRSKQ